MEGIREDFKDNDAKSLRSLLEPSKQDGMIQKDANPGELVEKTRL
jgi:hypothetical protein